MIFSIFRKPCQAYLPATIPVNRPETQTDDERHLAPHPRQPGDPRHPQDRAGQPLHLHPAKETDDSHLGDDVVDIETRFHRQNDAGAVKRDKDSSCDVLDGKFWFAEKTVGRIAENGWAV